jgi:hypothetical protein
VVRHPHRGALFDVVIEQLTPLDDEDAASLTGRIAATMLDRSEELRTHYPQADPEAPWWPPYSEPAEPSRTGRESLEQYRDTMAESVHRARERMAALADERDVQARVTAARDRAREAAGQARERAQVLGADLRLQTDELVELARSGELGGELRHRAEDLAAHVRELVDQLSAEDDALPADADGEQERMADPRVPSPAPSTDDT